MGDMGSMLSRGWRKITSFYTANPLFCILLGIYFLVHLHGITNPPLDLHSWRQADTAAVARNFQEESPNLLMPRIDMRGQNSGITGMEFPLYNTLIYGSNEVFGFAHWHGRLISLLASCMGLVFLYLFIKRRYDTSTALMASVFLAVLPLWFYFSRNIQPDVLMIAFSLGALYFAQRYSEQGKQKDVVWLLALFSLACLVKIPAIFIAPVILAIVGWQRIKPAITWQNVGLIVLILAVPSLLWYRHSAYLSANFGLGQYYYGDLSLKLSYDLLRHGGLVSVLQSYILPFTKGTFFFYVILLFGLIKVAARKDWLPLVWLGSVGAFLIIFGNKSYYHNYYSLPLMPALALLLAIGAVWLYKIVSKERRWLAIALSVIVLTYAVKHTYQTVKPWYELKFQSSLKLEQIVDKFSNRHDLFATNWGGNPQLLYFAHRKGWSISDFSVPSLLSLQSKGLRYAVLDTSGDNAAAIAAKASFEAQGIQVVYFDNNYVIVKL